MLSAVRVSYLVKLLTITSQNPINRKPNWTCVEMELVSLMLEGLRTYQIVYHSVREMKRFKELMIIN